MAITYTWKITGLKVQDSVVNGVTYPKAICQTYWQKTGTDENGNEGLFAGATPFTVDPTDDSGPFIPFSELKEQDIINWIQSYVTGEYEEHVNNKIQESIDRKLTQVIESNFPWAAN